MLTTLRIQTRRAVLTHVLVEQDRTAIFDGLVSRDSGAGILAQTGETMRIRVTVEGRNPAARNGKLVMESLVDPEPNGPAIERFDVPAKVVFGNPISCAWELATAERVRLAMIEDANVKEFDRRAARPGSGLSQPARPADHEAERRDVVGPKVGDADRQGGAAETAAVGAIRHGARRASGGKDRLRMADRERDGSLADLARLQDAGEGPGLGGSFRHRRLAAGGISGDRERPGRDRAGGDLSRRAAALRHSGRGRRIMMNAASEKDSRRSLWRGRVMYFVYWLVRVDPELLSGCPTIDSFQTISKAALLFAVACIALFAWGAFFLLFWPVWIALPLTLTVVVWIVLIDQFMGAARWTLHGVLAVPGKGRGLARHGTVILRLVIGVVTASATSFSATMAINHATIDEQLQTDRDAKNAAKRAAGEADKARLRQIMLGERDAEVRQAADAVEAVQGRLDSARRARDEASGAVTAADLVANCESQGGPGCHRGIGPMYRAAQIKRAKAAEDLRQAEQDIPALESALAAAEQKRDRAQAAVRAHEAAFIEAAKQIDERVAREAVPARLDPVMAYLALQKVFESPEGPAARFYSHLILTLLLTVELSYVLISEYFAHASVYMARLIARTKILATEVADEYRRKTGRGDDDDPPGAPSFWVVPRFPQGGSDAAE